MALKKERRGGFSRKGEDSSRIGHVYSLKKELSRDLRGGKIFKILSTGC